MNTLVRGICNNCRHSILEITVILLFTVCVVKVNGQCPVTNNNSFNYIANTTGSISVDWVTPLIWSCPSWVNPKVPAISGGVNRSLAINGNVVLHNAGRSIEFNQSTTICGSLKIEGDLVTSNGCSPLNIYGKVIVLGNVNSGQSIRVYPGGELIVFGNWNIKNGNNPTIDGIVKVKGDVVNNQGLTISSTGSLLIFGSYKASTGSNNINGNFIVTGKLTVPSWYRKGGSGFIYALSGGEFGGDKTLDQSAFDKSNLNGLYNKAKMELGLAPLKFFDLNIVSKNTNINYTLSGCGVDSVSKYSVNQKNRVNITNDKLAKSVWLKLSENTTDLINIEFKLNDSLEVSDISILSNNLKIPLNKFFYKLNKTSVSVFLDQPYKNDFVIKGLSGNSKKQGESITIYGVDKSVPVEISVFTISNSQNLIAKGINSTWDGKDINGVVVPAGVYYLKIKINSVEVISGQFIISNE